MNVAPSGGQPASLPEAEYPVFTGLVAVLAGDTLDSSSDEDSMRYLGGIRQCGDSAEPEPDSSDSDDGGQYNGRQWLSR